jgi:hypothetical protein
MQNVSVIHRPFITIALTADQWALYREQEGRDVAASLLSAGAEQAINSSANRHEAERRIAKLLEAHAAFGAADTEGYSVMYDLLDLAFPGY